MANETEALVNQRVIQLREEVMRGDYGASGVGRLPAVTNLAKRWSISRATVYQVLHILQLEGYVRSKGTSLIVNYPLMGLEGLTENFERYLKSLGHDATMDNLIIPTIEPMPHDAVVLFHQAGGIHENQTTVHRMRKQGITDMPLRIAENWYPESLAGQFVEEMRANERMDVVGAIKEVHGLYIVDVEDVLIARIPTPFEAKQLSVVRTEPIVEIRRSNFAEDGTPIMWNKIIHVAPHFKFTYRYRVNHWSK